VKTIAHRVLPAGPSTLDWDGDDSTGRRVASGVYYARLSAGDRHIVRKVVRLAP
jgi:hypothetical protein